MKKICYILNDLPDLNEKRISFKNVYIIWGLTLAAPYAKIVAVYKPNFFYTKWKTISSELAIDVDKKIKEYQDKGYKIIDLTREK